MLAVSIKISNIDYEKTFRQMFPMVKDKINSMESENKIIRLFQKLDDAALHILLGVMMRLPEETKNELLVQFTNTYSHKINEKLNEELVKNNLGKHLTVGCLSVIQEYDNLYLWINQVKADYKALVKEKLGRSVFFFPSKEKVEKMGMKLPWTDGNQQNKMGYKTFLKEKVGDKLGGIADFFPKEKVEKMGIELLWTDENKQKLMALVKSALDKYGFVMELDDIQLVQDKEEPVEAVEGEVYLELSDKVETDIVDALAGYLKDQVANEVLQKGAYQ